MVRATPNGDLYADDTMDMCANGLSAEMGAPHLIGRQVYGSSLYQGAPPDELVDIDDRSGCVPLYQLDAVLIVLLGQGR